MAVSTINPWAAGAVVLDQRPFLQFYERQMAREQAKNDALDNYFKGLDKNITSAGMRSQDVPTLLQKNKEWQEHYMQNKAAILNPKLDNGAAYNKYMSGYQDQMALTNESKQAYKNKEELGKLKFNKDFSYVFDDPDILKKIESDDLPIGHPQRQPFDMTSATLPPKPIDTKEREAAFKYIIGDAKQDKIPGKAINIGGFQTQTPITHQYSDETLKTFGDRAADLYDSDRNWKYDAKKLFDQVKADPILHKQLDFIYKWHYGNGIDNPREAFIAKTIMDHDIKTMEYQKGEDKLGLAKEMAALHYQYALKEMEAKQKLKNKSGAEQDSVIDDLYDTIKLDAIKNKKQYKPVQGQPFDQYEMKASGAVKKMFETTDKKGHKIYPDAVRYSKDFSTVTPIYFEHYNDNKGNRLPEVIVDKSGQGSVIKELSQPILEAEFKQRWKKELLGTSAYNKQLSNSSKPDDNEEINMESLRTKYNY